MLACENEAYDIESCTAPEKANVKIDGESYELPEELKEFSVNDNQLFSVPRPCEMD